MIKQIDKDLRTIEDFPYWIWECTPEQREYLIRDYIGPRIINIWELLETDLKNN